MEQQSNQISSGNNAPDELSKMQAEEVANRHGLDLNRVISVLERCSNTSSPFLAPLPMYLDRAIGLIGKDKAFALFESEDLAKLTKRIFWVDEINLSGEMLLYSLDQLVYFTEQFIHGSHLVIEISLYLPQTGKII